MRFKTMSDITTEQWLKIGGFVCLGGLFWYYALDLLRKDTPDRTITPVPVSAS